MLVDDFRHAGADDVEQAAGAAGADGDPLLGAGRRGGGGERQ
jgi:hypothetical protein